MASSHHQSKTTVSPNRRFSVLAGSLQRISKRKPYQVGFSNVNDEEQPLYRYWQQALAYGALLLTLAFAVILFRPSNWVVILHPQSTNNSENWIMLVCLILLQLFVIIRTFSATRATLKARNPIPVFAPKGLRVAFATTRAPGEPFEMVETTLRAAKAIEYTAGSVDVWLLDETDDPSLKLLCESINVGYFSRAPVLEWNTERRHYPLYRRLLTALHHFAVWGDASGTDPKPEPYVGTYAAKTKHGNFNAWLTQLERSGIHYDILAGVDTDQVPLPNYLTRILGYFNDPDVAFVVGPQVYGNYSSGLAGLVARWAESQASFFQSTIQRAANASSTAMFVGTNYAVRMETLRQVGGFQPCITEDMATGLMIHSSKNPNTNKPWKSVYTPDVLAIGEGPSFWGPYFTQQWRWAAGTFDTWKRLVFIRAHRLPAASALHYALVLTFYPMAALTWLLAIVSSGLYLLTGSTAIDAPWGQFLSLYTMAAVMQLSLYFWNRRYNVSPHETAGSYGISGMAITSLAAPIYFSALLGVAFGRRTKFVVTKKGTSLNPDWIRTFKLQLGWAAVEITALIIGITHGRDHPALIIWTAVILVPCLLPIVLGMTLAIRERPFHLPLPVRRITRTAGETTNA